MILIVITSLLLGSLIGSFVSVMIPEMIQIAGLVIILILATIEGFNKAVSVYKKETEQKQKEKQKDELKKDKQLRKKKGKRSKNKKDNSDKKEDLAIAESSADEFGGKATDVENNQAGNQDDEKDPVIFETRKTRKGGLKFESAEKNINKSKVLEMQNFKKDSSGAKSKSESFDFDSQSIQDEIPQDEESRPENIYPVSSTRVPIARKNDVDISEKEEKTGNSSLKNKQPTTAEQTDQEVIDSNTIETSLKNNDLNRSKKENFVAELPEDLKNFELGKKNSQEEEKDPYVATDESSSLSDGTTEESDVELSEKEAKIHAQIKKMEGSNFYYKKFLLILTGIIGSILVIFLRGGKEFESIIGAKKCDVRDWIVLAIYLIFIIAVSLISAYVVYKEQKLKIQSNWNFSKYEKQFTNKFLVVGNVIGFMTGMLSSIFGIGGGTILTPVMMSFNYLPQVISFTAMYLVVCNKLVSALVMLLTGLIRLDYLVCVGIFLFVAISLTEWKLDLIIAKIGRQSFISFIYVFIMFISIILVAFTGVTNVIEKKKNNENVLNFGSFC